MSCYEKIQKLRAMPGYYAQRIAAELTFAENYNRQFSCCYEYELDNQVDGLLALPVIGPEDVSYTEKALAPLAEKIKSLTVLAVSHSHIDMNWMWRYDETVAVTLSTFRTILNLMDEYPEFTFSQSQASVYSIVEKYDPDMLEEIKARVTEGRWELTVSTWVEPDKNMPSGETLCRHILYSKQYMNKLFGIDPDSLQLDFEPDTFGHNQNVPMILSNGGVKYYYHCRGYEGHHIYRWRSGEHEVLVYREPVWYNSEITFDDFFYMPEFASKNGINTLLKVYGVGDHGGGPTRRDVNRLCDMMRWPLMPVIKFGTYREFYQSLEAHREQFPIVSHELNAFATGCFTTQSRIKRFNKLCEHQLYEAEAFHSLGHMNGVNRTMGTSFRDAWERVLFNNFHDILPGSCILDTRGYALGKYQESLAVTSSAKIADLRKLAACIDTRKYPFEPDADSISEGGGVGFSYGAGVFSNTERNNTGKHRIYHLFNSTSVWYVTPSVITVWDYPGDLNEVEITEQDECVRYQLLDRNPVFYWGHTYQRIAVETAVPAMGYTTLAIRPKTDIHSSFYFPNEPRLDYEDGFVLENNLIRAELDTRDCSIRLLIDKRTGKKVIDRKAAFFQLITEDATKEMTAWLIGRYKSIRDLTDNVSVRPCDYIRGDLIQSLTYEIPFSESTLRVTVSLEVNSAMLKYKCTCDFREQPVVHVSVPQLSVCIPCSVQDNQYIGDIPFGHVTRRCQDLDMPCLNGVMVNTGTANLFAISNSKYGYRTTEKGISITLLRASYEPDPLPDFGPNEFDFAIGIAKDTKDFDDYTTCYNHSCTEVSAVPGPGHLPERGSLMEISGARVAALKISEDGKAYIIRLCDCKEEVSICVPFAIASASRCSLTEASLESIPHQGNAVILHSVEPLITVRIEKEE